MMPEKSGVVSDAVVTCYTAKQALHLAVYVAAAVQVFK